MTPDPIIYLNNAATSFPKPPSVLEAVRECLEAPPGAFGRGGSGEDSASACRSALAELLGVSDPARIVLSPSSTYALNLVIAGLLGRGRGAHAITTTLEHNSVLRPLERLREQVGLDVTWVEPDGEGLVNHEAIRSALRPETRLVAITHASNVTGAVQPIEAMAEVAADAGVPLLVDASQSAGVVPIDHAALSGRVFIAFAGHKGLYGPSGTGGLVLPDEDLPQTVVGGTGILSEQLSHPRQLPLQQEAGTPNEPGIAGQREGVDFVLHEGVDRLASHRSELTLRLRRSLRSLPRVSLSPLPHDDGRAGVTAFAVDGIDPGELGYALLHSFGIAVRTGLHCAPLAHRGLGTFPRGSVRVSVGAFNTTGHIDRLVQAMEILAS